MTDKEQIKHKFFSRKFLIIFFNEVKMKEILKTTILIVLFYLLILYAARL